MSRFLNETRQRMDAAFKMMTAITDPATRSGRPLSAPEQERADGYLADYKQAKREHDEEQKRVDSELAEVQREFGPNVRTVDSYSEAERRERFQVEDDAARPSSYGSPSHIMVNDEIRAYRHAESMARSVQVPPLPDGIRLEELSLARMLRGHVLGDWQNADAERRTMSGLSGTTGGFMIPDAMSVRIIDLARNKTILSQAGAVTVPMATRKLVVAKISGDPMAQWRKENQTIDESDATFGALELDAQVLAVLTRVSIELLEDASGFGSMLENQIANALALELDRAGLLGTGANEPLGLFNWPGLQEISSGTNGAAPTNYDQWSQAVQYLMAVNASPTTTVMAPRTWGTLDRLVDGTGVPLAAPESYKALRKLVSNQIPIDQTHGSATAASTAFVGGFENVLIGMRTSIVLEAFRQETDAVKNMQVLVRGYLRADIGVIRDTHLLKITGITA